MQTFALLACVVPALALAVPQEAAPAPAVDLGLPANYTWAVDKWHAGCYRNGCNVIFNVTGDIDGIYPGFKAECYTYDTGYYKPCRVIEGQSTSGTPSVAASLRPNFGNGIATASVSLAFTDSSSGITYNISGWGDSIYNAFNAPLQNFTITPSQVTQVL